MKGKRTLVGGEDFLHRMVETVAVHHDDVSTSQTADFDIGADANDLKLLRTARTRVGLFHLHHVKEPILQIFHGSSSILVARGSFGSPGIRRMLPERGITKDAP